IDRARNIWRNVFLVDLGDDSSEMKIVTASYGSLRQGERSEMPELYLQQGTWHQTSASKSASQDQPDSSGAAATRPNDARTSNSASADNPASSADSPASDKEKKRNRSQGQYTSGRFGEMTLGIEVSNDNKTDATGIDQEPTQV